MINAVGREIPEEILERTGKEVFQGNNYKDGKAFQKASPKVTPVMRNDHDLSLIHILMVGSRISMIASSAERRGVTMAERLYSPRCDANFLIICSFLL